MVFVFEFVSFLFLFGFCFCSVSVSVPFLFLFVFVLFFLFRSSLVCFSFVFFSFVFSFVFFVCVSFVFVRFSLGFCSFFVCFSCAFCLFDLIRLRRSSIAWCSFVFTFVRLAVGSTKTSLVDGAVLQVVPTERYAAGRAIAKRRAEGHTTFSAVGRRTNFACSERRVHHFEWIEQ